MIFTFTKLDGYEIGIDADSITDVTDMGHVRVIGTVADEYEVTETYANIVNAINKYRNTFVLKFYNN
jgi:hypothetical protein